MKGKHSEQKAKMKALTVSLLAVGVFCMAFIVAMIVIYCIKGSVPDALIQYTLGAGGFEALFCTVIQCVNTVFKKDKQDETEGEG